MPDKSTASPQKKGGDATARIRKDAEGQFAPKQHGGENDGLDSAVPVATTGDGDATFDNDPDGDDRGRDDR